jgi:hypothetical protein
MQPSPKTVTEPRSIHRYFMLGSSVRRGRFDTIDSVVLERIEVTKNQFVDIGRQKTVPLLLSADGAP